MVREKRLGTEDFFGGRMLTPEDFGTDEDTVQPETDVVKQKKEPFVIPRKKFAANDDTPDCRGSARWICL